MFTLFILALIVVCVSAKFADRADELFAKFVKDNHRSYASDKELSRRKEIFRNSMQRVDRNNEKNGSPVFGVTKYSDWTPEEFKVLLGRQKGKANGQAKDVKVRTPLEAETYGMRTATAFDPVVNWVKAGKVTAIKNQGQCGSCWAFSVAEQVESQWAMQSNALWEFSPQQVASCTSDCNGCGGGDTVTGFEYLMTLSPVGLGSNSYAPYMQSMYKSCSGPSCTYSCSNYNMADLQKYGQFTGPYAVVSGYSYATAPCNSGSCASQNTTLLATNIQTYGPASICVNAGSWGDYVGGVLSQKACGGFAADDLDHCVQLVGYNAQASKPYWLVRNSWATNWGVNGYIKLQYPQNTCGLANEATFVQISNSQSDFSI